MIYTRDRHPYGAHSGGGVAYTIAAVFPPKCAS